MMELVILFAGLVFARVQARAAEDVGDIIYDNTVCRGLELLHRYAAASRSGDRDATNAAASEYAAHLDKHPEEVERVVPAILKVVAQAEPLVVLAALTHVLCTTAAKVQQRPVGGGPSGCVAFTGSFVNPWFITVVDVRDKEGKPLQPPEIQTVDGTAYLDFDARMDSFYIGDTRPRMWIVKPNNPEDPEALARELNDMLLDRVERPDARVAHLKVNDVIAKPLGDSTAARGVLRIVNYVYADRVDIFYPDPEKEQALLTAKTLADEIIVRNRETEVDKLARGERRAFLVSAVDGPRALLSSLRAMALQDQELLDAWRDDWGGLGEEVAAN